MVTGTLNLRPSCVTKRTHTNHLSYAHSLKSRYYKYIRFHRVRLINVYSYINLIHGGKAHVSSSLLYDISVQIYLLTKGVVYFLFRLNIGVLLLFSLHIGKIAFSMLNYLNYKYTLKLHNTPHSGTYKCTLKI